MLFKVFFVIVLFWRTFEQGESLYFSHQQLTLEISSWTVNSSIHAVTAILDPDESGEIIYNLSLTNSSPKKNNKVGSNCPQLSITQSGHILVDSPPTLQSPTKGNSGNNITIEKRRRSLAPCSYNLEADLLNGRPGMRNEIKAHAILVLNLRKEKDKGKDQVKGKENEKDGDKEKEKAAGEIEGETETKCSFRTDEELCFDGLASLRLQVMENSEKVQLASFGYMKTAFDAACKETNSIQLKYSVSTSSKNNDEDILSIQDNGENPSLYDLWVRSNLDREFIPFYNLNVLCSLTSHNERHEEITKLLKLPGELEVLDQNDNPPFRRTNNATVNISFHTDPAKNPHSNRLEPGIRLQPDGGHMELTISDEDTVGVNNFTLSVLNDTRNLLQFKTKAHNLTRPNSTHESSLIILGVVFAERLSSWDGFYCVYIIFTDNTLVIGRENATIAFNICLHGGVEPIPVPINGEKEPACGSVCLFGLSFGSIIVAMAMVCYIFMARYRRSMKRRAGKIPVPSNSSGIVQSGFGGLGNGMIAELDYFVPNGHALVHLVDYTPPDPKWEIPRSAVILQDILGEGEFGRVVRGKFRNPSESQGRTMDVAVKMLKENEPLSGKSSRQEFMAEFSLLKQVDHRNVIKLIGVCTSAGGPPLLIMEYAEFKSLRSFLRKCRRLETSHCPTISYVTDPDFSPANASRIPAQETDWEDYAVTPKEILGFCWQIAKGMAYLSEMKMVHRDLAARNILLTSGKVCKISDFGLTRDVYIDDAYKKKSKDRVPVKWLAPECLSDELYTAKSDVWAFGIVCWELVMMGASPYPGIPTEQLFHLLKSGYRMPQPQNCSAELYDVMLQCWEYDPSERPRFRDLVDSLGKLLEDGIDYLQLNIPSISNPGYGFNVPSRNISININSSGSFVEVPNFDRDRRKIPKSENQNSMENLRLIDHCDDSAAGSTCGSAITAVTYSNGFAHTYINNRLDRNFVIGGSNHQHETDNEAHEAPSSSTFHYPVPSSSSLPPTKSETTDNKNQQAGGVTLGVSFLISSAYESPIKLKKSVSIPNDEEYKLPK